MLMFLTSPSSSSRASATTTSLAATRTILATLWVLLCFSDSPINKHRSLELTNPFNTEPARPCQRRHPLHSRQGSLDGPDLPGSWPGETPDGLIGRQCTSVSKWSGLDVIRWMVSKTASARESWSVLYLLRSLCFYTPRCLSQGSVDVALIYNT